MQFVSIGGGAGNKLQISIVILYSISSCLFARPDAINKIYELDFEQKN